MLVLFCFVVLIWTTVDVGAALAANNPSDRNEFAAEAAPTKLKTSVASVAKYKSLKNDFISALLLGFVHPVVCCH